MWNLKQVDFGSRPNISVITIHSAETKREIVELVRNRKIICRDNRTYYVEK